MSSVSKSSAFPDTVQPGIPKLPEHPPAGWSRTKFGAHLFEEKRPVRILHDKSYDLVTVKRARGGVVRRDTKLGGDISVKTQFEVKAGDFLISKRQIVHGACGLVPDALDGSTVSNEYAVLRGKSTIDLGYLNHFSNSVFFQQTCFHSSIGVHIEKMIFKTDKWLDSRFDLPPINEQKRIAELLSTWDRAIEATKKLIANSEAQKKALMQQLLTGEKRLPGFNGKWNKRKLRELVEIVYGSSPKGRQDSNGRYPIIGTGGIVGRTNEVTCIDPSVVIGRKGTIDRPQLVEEPFWAIDTTYFCRPRKCDLNWLYQILSSLNWRKYNEASGVPSLSRETLYPIPLLVPELLEQAEIGKVLRAADTEISLQNKRLLALEKEKSALMQQLLTGKRRVKFREAAA